MYKSQLGTCKTKYKAQYKSQKIEENSRKTATTRNFLLVRRKVYAVKRRRRFLVLVAEPKINCSSSRVRIVRSARRGAATNCAQCQAVTASTACKSHGNKSKSKDSIARHCKRDQIYELQRVKNLFLRNEIEIVRERKWNVRVYEFMCGKLILCKRRSITFVVDADTATSG